MAFPRISANHTPLDPHRVYVDDEGRQMCSECADKYVTHMTGRKVTMFTLHGTENCYVCDDTICGTGEAQFS